MRVQRKKGVKKAEEKKKNDVWLEIFGPRVKTNPLFQDQNIRLRIKLDTKM